MPSSIGKFTSKIIQESKRSGGFTFDQVEDSSINVMVLDGDHTGMWKFQKCGGQIKIKWETSFRGYVKQMRNRYQREGNNLVATFPAPDQNLSDYWRDVTRAMCGGEKAIIEYWVEGYGSRETPEDTITSIVDWYSYKYYRYSNLPTPHELYIFRQVARMSLEELRMELLEEPRRLYRIKAAMNLARKMTTKDRIPFIKKMAKTWKIEESIPTWLKKVPRWHKAVEKVAHERNKLSRIKALPHNWMEHPDAGIWPHLPLWLGRKIYGRPNAHLINDAWQMRKMIPNAYFSQLHGRLDWEKAVARRSPERILKLHDWISAKSQEYNMTKGTSKEIIQERIEKRGWPDTDEVKVLRTAEQWLTEGHEMGHCVASYFNKAGVDLMALSIKTEEGRSTPGLSLNGKVIQHQGYQNGEYPKTHDRILKNYIKMLKERELLRKKYQ